MTEAVGEVQVIKGENVTNTLVPTTVEEFELWLAERPELTNKRFEFVDGQIIEKTGMKQEELFISTFLMRLFIQTQAFQNGDILHPEIDTHINKRRKRIADLAYFTKAQIKAARKGKRTASSFAIEIISKNDSQEENEKKIQDYFDSGTKLVWYISPNHHQIYVYTSPTDVKILKGDVECSAIPVLPDFSFKVKEMFE